MNPDYTNLKHKNHDNKNPTSRTLAINKLNYANLSADFFINVFI